MDTFEELQRVYFQKAKLALVAGSHLRLGHWWLLVSRAPCTISTPCRALQGMAYLPSPCALHHQCVTTPTSVAFLCTV